MLHSSIFAKILKSVAWFCIFFYCKILNPRNQYDINRKCLLVYGCLSTLSPLSLDVNTLFTEKSIRRFITNGIIMYDISYIVGAFGNYTSRYLCHINLFC